jgi:hypothetical protein
MPLPNAGVVRVQSVPCQSMGLLMCYAAPRLRG